LQLHGNAQFKSTYIPSLSTWTHIAVTVNTSGLCIGYANGSEVWRTTEYHYQTLYPVYGQIGSTWGATEFFYGYLDEVRIYTKVISIKDIGTLANLKPVNFYQTYDGITYTPQAIEN
jgi:hypothetical protein